MTDYSTLDVVARTGATYRQVDYWTRTGIVTASIQPAEGTGSQRRYSQDDLWRIAVVRTLLAAGVSLTTAREVLDTVATTGIARPHEHCAIYLDLAALAARLRLPIRTGLELVPT